MTRSRRARLIALAVLAVAPAVAAADEAIPFDAKKAKAIADRERAWMEAVTRTAYKEVGRRSPKWDATVDVAMRAVRDRRAGPVWARATAEARARVALRDAAEAGCDDPLVQYFLVLYRDTADDETKAEEVRAGFLKAARELAASKYPPIWAARAYVDSVEELVYDPDGPPQEAEIRRAEKCLGDAFKLMAAAARDKEPAARRELADLCELVHRHGARAGRRNEWFDRAAKEFLAGLPKGDPLPDACTGRFLVKYAWDARGDGVAATVSREGWELFRERLAEAERRFKAAWDLDSGCALAATEMITVCMGLGHDREEMEAWFRRAVAADPSRTDAFERKMFCLYPRWHGSVEEVLAFGRQAVALGQWDTALPTLMLQAHDEAAVAARDGLDYYRREAVWAEMESVLEGIRKHNPKSPTGAVLYLKYARGADRNGAQAHAYATAADGPLPPGPFGLPEGLASALEWAEEAAKEAKAKK